MTEITKEAIEAALEAYAEGVYLTDDQVRASVVRIVEAALSTLTIAAGKIVAWRTFNEDGTSDVTERQDIADQWTSDGFEVSPLVVASTLPIAGEGKVDPDEEMYQIGHRDGYSQAVQQIDRLTGGDGEYRYCTDHDPERHTPGPAEMIQRIVDRFEVLNLLDDATKTGRDQEWGVSPSSPGKDSGQEGDRI